MRRRPIKLLEDIRLAGTEIRAITAGITFDDYKRHSVPRLAIERLFLNIGEAVRRMRDEKLDIFNRITNANRVIGFRNALIHGYDVVDDDEV